MRRYKWYFLNTALLVFLACIGIGVWSIITWETAEAQNENPNISSSHMPLKVTQLPLPCDPPLQVALTPSNGANQAGIYYCPTHNTWVCLSCGGGGFTPGTDLSGTSSNQTVVGIQTIPVVTTGLADNVFLYYASGPNQWKVRKLLAADIPPLDATIIASGFFDQARIPRTLNGDFTINGNLSASSFTATTAGQSFLELNDNVVFVASDPGTFSLSSITGQVGLSINGGSFDRVITSSLVGAPNFAAALDGTGRVPPAQLGTGGTGGTTRFLREDGTWQVPAGGGGGVSFPILAPAGSAAAPSIAVGDTNTGLFQSGTGLLDVSLLGTAREEFGNGFFWVKDNTGCYELGVTADAFLCRDAANKWGQRNGVASQEFRVYNTFTSSTSYEAASINLDAANIFVFEAQKGSGGGTARSVGFRTNGVTRWQVDTTGNLRPISDGSVNIGGTNTTVSNIFLHGLNDVGSINAGSANDGVTGTTVNQTAQVNASGNLVRSSSGDAVIGLGPVQSGNGTTGSAFACIAGVCTGAFDGATTAGHYVIGSTGTQGKLRDAGFGPPNPMPAGVTVFGITLTTNGAAGNFTYIGSMQQPVIKHQRFGASCSTAAATGSACSSTFTWAVAWTDANYHVVCNGENGSSGAPMAQLIGAITATNFSYGIVAGTAAVANYSAVDCIATHD